MMHFAVIMLVDAAPSLPLPYATFEEPHFPSGMHTPKILIFKSTWHVANENE